MTTETNREPMADRMESSTAVAVFKEPRLPWHPAIEARFGVTKSEWRVLTDSVFPSAKTPDAVCLAISYCNARKLDIMKKMVHIVPIYDRDKRCEVETVWPSIAETRATAHRTGQYGGADPTSFGEERTETFEGDGKRATVTYPAYCQITVYRIINGVRCAFPGPRVVWKESYGRHKGTALPNKKWETSASYMLEKCAEAAALRKAFPEELGTDLTAEEVEGRIFNTSPGSITIDQEPPKPAQARPQRGDPPPAARSAPAGDQRPTPPHDADTGEVKEDVKPTPAAKTDKNGQSSNKSGPAPQPRQAPQPEPEPERRPDPEDDRQPEPDDASEGPVVDADEDDAPAPQPTAAEYAVNLEKELVLKINNAGFIAHLNAIDKDYENDLVWLKENATDSYNRVKAALDGKRAKINNRGRK